MGTEGRSPRDTVALSPQASSLNSEGSVFSRVLIVRLGSFGDIIHALPVAAALREAFPHARIDWLVDARYRALLDLVPVLDRRLVLGRVRPASAGPGKHAARSFSRWSGLSETLREFRRGRYEVAFDLQGLLKSAMLARLSGAPRVIGFSTRHLREKWARAFYSETVDPPLSPHVVEKNLAALASIGIFDPPRQFPLEVGPSSVADRVRRDLDIGPEGRYAVVNPGGGWPNKRWPPARFGAVAAGLRARHRLPSVVAWGPGEEELARAVVQSSEGAAQLGPPTTLGDLVELLRGASLVVAGDTGPLHIAAAVGTPIVGIYGPTNPARNGPWDPCDVTLSRFADCVCHHKRRCRRPVACVLDISIDEVMGAIDRRLGGRGPGV
jgi:heptosyltransferase I